MARADFIALAWRPDDPVAIQAAQAAAARLDAEPGWRAVGDTAHVRLWAGRFGRLDVRMLPQGEGLVIGDLFDAPAPRERSPFSGRGEALRQPARTARRLASSHWGHYLALLEAGGDRPPSVFRDPSGAMSALTWPLAPGVDVVASDLAPTLGWARPRRYGLDWDRLARFVAAPASVVEPLFEGVEAVGPGDLRPLCAPNPVPTPIWRPSDFVTPAPTSAAEAAAVLRARVDDAVARLADRYPRLVADLSGGLDSAIIAGSLHRQGRSGQVQAWVNRYAARREGDERAYARAVTDRMGADLTTVAKTLEPFSPDDLVDTAAATWPALNGADPARDRDMAGRLRSLEAEGLLSGQGGDALFFQMPSALVVADAVRAQGFMAIGSPLVRQLADRSRTSVWDILRQGLTALRAADPMPDLLNPFLSRQLRAACGSARHPWARSAAEASVAPARRLQIAALVNAQIYRGDCRRRRAADLLFPLMAQPVAEHCLGIPITDLAAAAYDRPFARATFAGDLPDAVRLRRSKGNLTAHFAQWVAASLPTLRPFLLDGCLAEAGVLDRARLDRALDPQTLIWSSAPGQLIAAATIEAWVRHWQTRTPDSLTAPRDRPRFAG